jgi:pimeloyl-ACP methyl ester carboxylesterase
MATFSLVHGAWHGGWAWDLVRPELEARGHTVHAPDLPCDDPDAGVDDYAAAVPRADVLVGHSLAGHTIVRVPASLHVFLCALVPGADESDSAGSDYELDWDETGRRHRLRDAARSLGYPDEHAGLVERLRWQTALERPAAPLPEPSAYIACSRDLMISPEWQRRVARDVLHVEPLELDAGHSPMLTHPRELAELLDSLV